MLMTHMVNDDKKPVIPAVTHADGSFRLQAISKEYNRRYWELIDRFKQATRVGLVLNTSFNLWGESIVSSPGNAINTFLNSGIDLLVLGNFLVEKH